VSSDRWFQFSVGPVQSWVARSRRIDDLWSSSFLLSHLTGTVLKQIEDAGGTILLPRLTHQDSHHADPQPEGRLWGTVPNRVLAKVDASFAGESCIDTFQATWRSVAAAVQSLVDPYLSEESRAIWCRQVDAFWELYWALGDVGDLHALERRKLWRTHRPPDEPGDKCLLFAELQELSGVVRGRSAQDRERQDAFWETLRSGLPAHRLQDGERLSAIALIKRMFPVVAKRLNLPAPRNFPSTLQVAAVPWLAATAREDPTWLREYGELAARVLDLSGTSYEWFPSLRNHSAGLHQALSLDGVAFHPTSLRSDAKHPEVWRQLESAWRGRESESKQPSTYFAVVALDGDRMGEWLATALGPITTGIARFSEAVEQLAGDTEAVVVYAGGDDVLALSPVDSALPFAEAVAKLYHSAFEGIESPSLGVPTISAGLVYSHMTAPLSVALQEAHRLLDQEAKERLGRDSIAIQVLRSSGPDAAASWAGKWHQLHSPGSLSAVVTTLKQPENTRIPGVGASYLHRVVRLLSRLGPMATEVDLVELLRAEMDAPADDLHREVARTWAGFVSADISAAPAGLLLARFIGSEVRT
jgi:CRISPR-associated protein Cmr2